MASRHQQEQTFVPQGPGVAGDEAVPPHEVLAALVASLRHELAGGGVLEQARRSWSRPADRLPSLRPGCGRTAELFQAALE